MSETCERLVQAGLPLWRVGVFVRMLHPDVFGRGFFWRPGAEVVVDGRGFRYSRIRRNTEAARSRSCTTPGGRSGYRLDDPDSRRFPFFDDMRAEGVTDYIALPLLFIDGSIHASSWTTKQPGGFSDDELAALRSMVPPLARVIEIVSLRRKAVDPARHLCRQPRRRADPRRPDPPRPHRDHACRDLAVGSARLHRAVRPAAGRNRGGHPQSLFRLPGVGDPRRMAERS